jgi:DNA-binding NtrC family response regulator
MLDDASLKVAHARRLKDAAKQVGNRTLSGRCDRSQLLEDGNGLDLFQRTRSLGTELVVTDPWADGRRWPEAINLGVYDLLAQPFHETEVRRLIASASATAAAMEVETLDIATAEATDPLGLDGTMIASSAGG